MTNCGDAANINGPNNARFGEAKGRALRTNPYNIGRVTTPNTAPMIFAEVHVGMPNT